MNLKKISCAILAAGIAVFMANAELPKAKVEFQLKGDSKKSLNIPADLAPLVNQYKGQIEQALITNNVTSSEWDDYQTQIDKFYQEYGNQFSSATPFTDTIDGLNDFCDDLVDSIPNTQGMQNIYADAWIGKLIPGAHFGGGINVGASSLDISALKDTAAALEIDTGDIGDTLAFPTVNADLRLGGILLPFDIGVAVMKFDSSSYSFVEDAIDPVSFDYYVVGGDIRYALIKGGMLRPKVSVGAGYYYTSGSIEVKDDTASAGMDFSSKAFIMEAQASIKLLFLVPFVGTKLIVSKTKVDWSVDANWAELIDVKDDSLAGIINNGILPSHFEDSTSSTTFHPQLFGGVGFDLGIMSLTTTLGYDVKSSIISGAVSARISW